MIKLYGFLEGPVATGGWEVTVTCQCGMHLVRRISAKAEDALYDIGISSHEQHEIYHAHCAEQHQGEPFTLEWVDDPSNYQGVRQSDVEVVDWNEHELSSLGDVLRTAFSAQHEKSPTPPENDL